MNKKLFFSIFLVVILTLSACSPAEETQEPTVVPVPATNTSAPTIPPAPEATDTSMPVAPVATETPAIVNPEGCTDQATFVADVTVPDNTSFSQGVTFNKVWRIKNDGTCTWTPDYNMVFAAGEQMGAPASIPLDVTRPDETLDITIDMTAPGSDGNYRADFELRNPAGVTMPVNQEYALWVIITVSGTAGAPAPGTTGTSVPGAACNYVLDPGKVTEVVSALNSYRAQNGLPALTNNALLQQAAQAHSADMACNSLFSHDGSDGSTPDSRVAATGYAASGVTENVYGSYPPLTGQGVVSWWATDQGDTRHNDNLLTTKYTEIGVGYSFYNNFGYYAVVFAAP